MRYSLLAAVAFAATSVSAHGNITWPPARLPGPAMLAACGQEAVNTVLGDGTIALEEVKPASPRCNVGLCRGAQFEDNVDRVQTFSLGQVVVIEVDLTIPHEGPANISIVQTATNTIIGDMLLFFDTYADEKLTELPANNSAFGVTFPTGTAGDRVAAVCRRPGDCVLQWWWLGTDAKQTYESCIDFVLAPAGAGGPNAGANQRDRNGFGNVNPIANPSVNGAVGAGADSVLATPPVAAAPVPAPVPLANDPTVLTVATEGVATTGGDSFGGIVGSVSVAADGVSSVDNSFGGVVGSAPARRSRVYRGVM